ncbi:MAG: acetyl-CoA carboxylase biotin carboxylase subunit [Candidatus Eremiobacteraeota bacterium]|nr:acetyl-CoA carboxylase biotin carboxylase subunit [Candidatus Eremiobacteraeota bacterium]MCW5866392.1 acetyl-CoA carboxylase biotin carboxylase subunit [Candidatus Eremiobacteraeota bacterium]
MFSRILIANRGEIAVRLLRACRELGISPALAYAPIDRDTLAVELADVAVELKGDTPRGCYLDIEGLVAAAKKVGAQAIHPGYGFVSENADFSQLCRDSGIVFIGPSPEVIYGLGNKNQARKLMTSAGLPVVPGTEEPVPTVEEAVELARSIGYPLLVKASGGGGGRGMRKVDNETELRQAFPQARSESQAAFGSGELFLEKYVERPRHVEIQILGDAHGNAVYLGERECSIQRRFQKMIEEAPSPALTPELRERMGQAAVAGAKKLGYCGAGTFEFLVDAQRNFYFLEVNTRLQVEHPVTEQITGLDLVKLQIRVAHGEVLPIRQEDVQLRGWSMECRITCEDPYRGFLPTPGKIERLHLPAGPGVRVDTHLYQGYEVPGSFDSMVAKLITTGRDREEARTRMLVALREFQLAGISHTIPFHLAVLEHPEFVAGNLTTHFLPEYLPKLARTRSPQELDLMTAVAAVEGRRSEPPAPAVLAASEAQLWKMAGR